MNHSSQTSHMLHEEHFAAIGLLHRLQALLLKHRDNLPDTSDMAVNVLLGDLSAGVRGEISSHFAFEEEEIFPRLRDNGYTDITHLLSEEHDIILPLAIRLAEMAETFRKDGISPESWQTFSRDGLEFIERLQSHIQKEEMGLLPMVDDVLEAGDDRELAFQYAQER